MRRIALLTLALLLSSLPVQAAMPEPAKDFVPASAAEFRVGLVAALRENGYEVSDFEQVPMRGENKGNLVRYVAELDSEDPISLHQTVTQEDQIVSCYAGWAPNDATDVPASVAKMMDIWKIFILATGPSVSGEQADALLERLLDGTEGATLSKETEYNRSVSIAQGYALEITIYNGYVYLNYRIWANLPGP